MTIRLRKVGEGAGTCGADGVLEGDLVRLGHEDRRHPGRMSAQRGNLRQFVEFGSLSRMGASARKTSRIPAKIPSA